ncbi:MAG: hypothetical protein B7Y56_15925 [Gallionellales bacterium 35-53-114]|jgi:hypothetical protein|nr:MAG: hypothetical protein B7Y56_15925 [Gallionellales bacterium 35-53-114]OYZ62156.1 MAG: hypothetical protein B7Y04_15550 [Gallionellales bacterium 24-53-125]OZB07282.1 MAG: hypothetical protein B7X61_15070 [Gallionellales bacterium 39-52-133]
MLRRLHSLLRSLLKVLLTTDTKISCYHCGEKSRKSQTLYVFFNGATRPVCCYGCAAILKTVEELGMHDEYQTSKINTPYNDE